jgi:hypothetical protein
VTTKSLSAKFNPYGKATSWRYGLATKKGGGTIGNKLKAKIEIGKEKGKLTIKREISPVPTTAAVGIRHLREIKAVFLNKKQAKEFVDNVVEESKKMGSRKIEKYESGEQLAKKAFDDFKKTGDSKKVSINFVKAANAPTREIIDRIKNYTIAQLEEKELIKKNDKDTVRSILDKHGSDIEGIEKELIKEEITKPEKRKELSEILNTYQKNIEKANTLEGFFRGFLTEAKAAGMEEKEAIEVLKKVCKEYNDSIDSLKINRVNLYNEFKKQGMNISFGVERVEFDKVMDEVKKNVKNVGNEEKESDVKAFNELYQSILRESNESNEKKLSHILYSNPTILLNLKEKRK